MCGIIGKHMTFHDALRDTLPDSFRRRKDEKKKKTRNE